MMALPSANITSAIQSGRRMPIMATRHDIESARLSMLEARKALEDYETLKGFASSCEHTMLAKIFSKATEIFLRLSASQR
jgi:hypothetical protein